MAFAQCAWPIWRVDDFTGCFRRDFLRVLLPSLLVCISLLVLVPRNVRQHMRSTRNNNSQPSVNNGDQYESTDNPEQLAAGVIDESLTERTQYIVIVVVVGIIVVNAIAFTLKAYGPGQNLAALLGIVIWLYVLALAVLQLVLSTARLRQLKLRNHLACIYALQWLFKLLLFWSAITHPKSRVSQALTIAEFFLTSLLFTIIATTQNGDRAVSLEGGENLDPPREPLASLLSKATFWWVFGIVLKGFSKVLNMKDIPDLPLKDKAIPVVANSLELKGKTLPWHLIYHFRFGFLRQCFYSFFSALLVPVPVLLFKAIVEYIESPAGRSPNIYVILLTLTLITMSTLQELANWIGFKSYFQIKTILYSQIYAKVLGRKISTTTKVNAGTIANYISVDVDKIADIITLHEPISSAPVQLIGCTTLLWHTLGLSCIPGFVAMICFLLVSIFFPRKINRAQKERMNASDERIHTTNEALRNIDTVKLLAQEEGLSERIGAKRSAELRALRRLKVMEANIQAIEHMMAVLATLLSFMTYTLGEKKPLQPSVAFLAISLFRTLLQTFKDLIVAMLKILEALIAAGRLEKFLNEPETEKYKQLRCTGVDEGGNEVFGFRGASLSWGGEHASGFSFTDIDVKFANGKLNIITGRTGSGKTSLLLALLGEMPMFKGVAYLPGSNNRGDMQPDPETGLTDSVAYCRQKPWLVKDNIKNNILLGSTAPIDEERYNDVLVACNLDRDIESFKNDDQTSVGEMSGGQKARISLARALYSRSRHLLLDDCLSAIDSNTAKWIVQNFIKGRLMRNRTCIFVTHDNALVPLAEHVVVLEDGQIAVQGTPGDVTASGTLRKTKIAAVSEAVPTSNKSQRNAQAPRGTVKNVTASLENTASGSKAASGIVFFYLGSMGPWWFWLFGIMVFGLQPLSSAASNIWLRHWTNQYDPRDISVPAMLVQDVDVKYNLAIYALTGLAEVLFAILHSFWTIYGSLTASSHIHQKLLKSVCHAKFAISVPQGQLMSRFSGDLARVDQEVALRAVAVIDNALQVVLGISLISTITPRFLVAAICFGVLCFLICLLYIKLARQLRRLESSQRSLLFQRFGEVFDGNITIRAYGLEKHSVREFLKLIDIRNRPHIYLCATNRWFSNCLRVIGALVTSLACVFVISKTTDPGSAGLILSYVTGLIDIVIECVRCLTKGEQDINCLERIMETANVEQEKEVIGRIGPPTNWPSRGSVRFTDYTARYRADLEPVLQSINFTIYPGQKVGIAGRTGAGKSSLALALFRGLEAEKGKILIDDYDIGHAPLRTLRESVGIVPQEALLFDGTVRSNIDPNNFYTDEQILKALRLVSLVKGPAVVTEPLLSVQASDCERNIFSDLSTKVTESGNNFSQGQRQLLCLARALVKEPKILLMDEATASTDHITDAKIQKTIDDRKDTTIIIAHRLQTLINCDVILVLQKGRVAESGHSYDLLKKGGLFKDMCMMTENFGDLYCKAKQAKKLIDDE